MSTQCDRRVNYVVNDQLIAEDLKCHAMGCPRLDVGDKKPNRPPTSPEPSTVFKPTVGSNGWKPQVSQHGAFETGLPQRRPRKTPNKSGRR